MAWRNGRKGWSHNRSNRYDSNWASNRQSGDAAPASSRVSCAAERNPGMVTTTPRSSTDDDDWGCFADKEREPYVYQPAWALEMPHLLANPPKHCINPREMWRIGSSGSDDEEEERASGGSTAVNKKMPSATLTARRPSYPAIKPVRLAVGELSDPLADKSLWSSKIPDKIEETTPEVNRKLGAAVRVLAGEEEREDGEELEIPYSVDLKEYQPKFSKRGGIDYKSFIPPLPSQEDIDKVKEEAAATQQQLTPVTVETIGGKGEIELELQDAVVSKSLAQLPDTSTDQTTVQDQADIKVKEGATSDEDRLELPPLTMDDICPPLRMDVPFIGRLIGFLDGGFALIRFCDNKTKAQFQNLLDTVWDYFGSRPESDLVVPPAQIIEDIIVFGKLPPDSKGAGHYARVRITKINPKERTALCKDLDTWVMALIPFDNIYYMPPTFLEVPFLMHRCRLKGLEFWCEGRVMQEIAIHLPSLAEDIYITHYETDSDGFPLVEVEVKLAKSASARSRGLGLSSSDTNAIMLGDLVSRTITGFTRIPRQFVKGMLMDRAHVSNVDKEGRAWISLHSALASRLVSIGENPKRIMSSQEFNLGTGPTREVSDFEYAFSILGERRFLAHFLDDRGHFRVEINEFNKGDKEVKAHYLDFGNTEVIPVTDVYPTALFDPLLNKIVPQVIQGYLNGITAIRDADEFFEHITIKQPQRITVSGFQQPNATLLLDIHTQLHALEGSEANVKVVEGAEASEKKKEWTYVNQYVVDQGLATPHKGGIIPFRRVGGEEEETKNILHMRQLSMTDPTAKKRADCLKVSERNRYVTSCRIEQEDDGRYAYLSIKPKKIKPLIRSSGLDPMNETDEYEEEEEEEEE